MAPIKDVFNLLYSAILRVKGRFCNLLISKSPKDKSSPPPSVPSESWSKAELLKYIHDNVAPAELEAASNRACHDSIKRNGKTNPHKSKAAAAVDICQPPDALPDAVASTWTNVQTRFIALKFYYLGWNYQGLSAQSHTPNTIEQHVVKALQKTCLIHSLDDAQLTRCGRTDKGVSAFNQVVSLRIKCRKPADESHKSLENWSDARDELPYVRMLNSVLPKDIRMMAWAPVTADFSARFNCKWRKYKYYFTKSNLDISKMQEATAKLIGTHDFRNFCKFNGSKHLRNYMRAVLEADIRPVESVNTKEEYSLYRLEIKGTAFLWHQIRNIMAVLFMVGKGQEAPSIIDDLLSLPTKPSYLLAHEIPLVLFDCQFDDLDWLYVPADIEKIIDILEEQIELHGAQYIQLIELCEMIEQRRAKDHISGKAKGPNYVSLLKKPREDNFEERQRRYDEREKEKELLK